MKFKPSLLLPAHRFPGEDAGPGTAQRGHAWLVAGLMAALLYPSSSEAMMALTGTPEAVTARTADVADATAAVTGTAAGAPAESSAGTAGKSTENAPARPAILSVSPQGEVYRPRQMVVKFDAPAARFGDAGAESPVLLSCSGLPDAGPDASSSPPASPLGSGRWTGPQEWVQDFLAPLPAGVRCQVSTRPDYRTPSGVLLKPSRHAFDTGGPRIDRVRPWEGDTIEEDQVFVLRLDAPATIASLKQHVWCRQPDLGEQVPVRLVEGERRQAILSGLRYASGEQPAGGSEQGNAAAAEGMATTTLAVLQCQRRFTPGTEVSLVYDRGVALTNGMVSTQVQRMDFKVRQPFTAEMSCERENAQAGCMPIRPITVNFSAPIPKALAAQVHLQAGGQKLRPQWPGPDGEGFEAADPAKAGDGVVESLRFAPPLAEQTTYSLVMPEDLHDASGRTLRNAASFPLSIRTAALPPLAKFGAAPFGIVERFAEGPDGPALLPLTVRRVEADLAVQDLQPAQDATRRATPQALGGARLQLSQLQAREDGEIIRWLRRVNHYDEGVVNRRVAAQDARNTLPASLPDDDADYVEARMVSLLENLPQVQSQPLPDVPQGDVRPFEVLGIPLSPGFHVLEVASGQLGQALLNAGYGDRRTMYVRTAVLVTNLGVHFKQGRDGGLAWVTTLDQGRPVANARVRVTHCNGQLQAEATTDAQGVARFPGLEPFSGECGENDYSSGSMSGYFVSARAEDHGVQDMSFVWSSWQEGIEPWRFDVPTSSAREPEVHAHTVMDRTLLRAGETLSMKHLIRTEKGLGLADAKVGVAGTASRSADAGAGADDARGFGLPDSLPDTLVITHVGSDQRFTQPLTWRSTATGGRSAESHFAIPPGARLGQYRITLTREDERIELESGTFRVEEFRLPVYRGSVLVRPTAGNDQADVLVAGQDARVDMQLDYVAGGPAAAMPVQVSAMLEDRTPEFAGYEAFDFESPSRRPSAGSEGNDQDATQDADTAQASRGPDDHLVANRLPLMLDAQGHGLLTLPLPASPRPQTLTVESSYADPNGEIQTLRGRVQRWPAAVQVGMRAESGVSVGKPLAVQLLALGTDGKPRAGVPLTLTARMETIHSSRKRVVGGFYVYDSHVEQQALGTLCQGKSDAQGLLDCQVSLDRAGDVQLQAVARDAEGHASVVERTLWVSDQAQWWFGGGNHDRIDIIPEKRVYAPGETARFQVRMPFREATALVAVEREGIIRTQVVELKGDDPTVSLKVEEGWTPNVYVSVLALRGRLRDVPWYSFFGWGWRHPGRWWDAWWQDDSQYQAPTPLVDLSKPAFRFGMAEIRVGDRQHRLDVKLQADRESYPVRGHAQVDIAVTLPDGRPAAHAEVAVAAVDEALLELLPNTSWKLLEGMLSRRAWGVETATAQMEIVGRRHYGRKALPPGGDGTTAARAGGAVRELLDTLLLWQPKVQLDAQGKARVTVPLNDALTTFRVVAVADSGISYFGTGQTHIRTAQDLQLISGLPPLVRTGDRFQAGFTVRNTTQRPMTVQVAPRAALLTLEPQIVQVPVQAARQVWWEVTAPATLAELRPGEMLWEVEAQETGDKPEAARDVLKVNQRIVAATPVSVQQATLVQLGNQPITMAVALPASALPGRGGLQLNLRSRLYDGLPAVQAWFQRYPYSCLEQQASKAIGLHDAVMWREILEKIPTYLDDQGLADYFPLRGGSDSGSPLLTAWLLSATHEASRLDATFALPQATREQMVRGLTMFVEGKLSVREGSWMSRYRQDMRLMALEALSRHDAVRPAMLDGLEITPARMGTAALLDWIGILQRVPQAPARVQRLHDALQALRARVSYQGSRIVLQADEMRDGWWRMGNGDVDAARLLLAVLDDPAWKEDLGRIVTGLLARQQRGAWQSTTANLWGSLAVARFGRQQEDAPVNGVTKARLGSHDVQHAWADERMEGSLFLPWPATIGDGARHGEAASATSSSAPRGAARGGKPAASVESSDRLEVLHQGSGRPWLTLQSLAAVPRTQPFFAGYRIRRTVVPMTAHVPTLPAGRHARGDVLRVRLEIEASAPMEWVVISDPVPAGATLLGSGLGRDSALATQDEDTGDGWLAYQERGFEWLRSYYRYLPAGRTSLEYTLRVNNPGTFQLPPTRVEALYAPEMFGELPNATITVQDADDASASSPRTEGATR